MKVQTDLEIKHFITYLNHFQSIYVVRTEFHKAFWYITFSDGVKYSMSDSTWHKVQVEVDRFKVIYNMVH